LINMMANQKICNKTIFFLTNALNSYSEYLELEERECRYMKSNKNFINEKLSFLFLWDFLPSASGKMLVSKLGPQSFRTEICDFLGKTLLFSFQIYQCCFMFLCSLCRYPINSKTLGFFLLPYGWWSTSL
jgi:hypothetical protein